MRTTDQSTARCPQFYMGNIIILIPDSIYHTMLIIRIKFNNKISAYNLNKILLRIRKLYFIVIQFRTSILCRQRRNKTNENMYYLVMD